MLVIHYSKISSRIFFFKISANPFSEEKQFNYNKAFMVKLLETVDLSFVTSPLDDGFERKFRLELISEVSTDILFPLNCCNFLGPPRMN